MSNDDKMTPAEERRVSAALTIGAEQEQDELTQLRREHRELTACLGAATRALRDPDRDPAEALLDIIRTLAATKQMTDFEHKLVALLDRIEVEEDSTLASQRFALAEEQGYTVVITGEIVSGSMN